MKSGHKLIAILVAVSLTLSGCGGSEKKGENTVDSRVINGDVASDLAPGAIVGSVIQVSLMYPDGTAGFCSGVLVTPMTVVTSGHCLVEGSPKVVAVSASDGASSVATRFAIHPDYRVDEAAGAIFGDVAAIHISPALAVPPAPLLQSVTMQASEVVTVAGYGLDENGDYGVLKVGTMTISLATENHLLAFYSGDGSNTCNGDSGGPAIGRAVTIDGNGLEGVVGLISSGSLEDCREGDTTYFTNLQNAAIVSWLIEQDPAIALR